MSNFSFGDVPVIRHSRSRFDLSHGVKTSGNVGTLYPFEVQEVYFGDTFKVKTSCVSRLTSQFLRPVMDNLFLDVYYFFVPSRILYDKYVNVFGENTESAYANTQEYVVPTVSGNVPSKTVGDYLGLPVQGVNGVNILPFRAFAKIYDDWFRDQNNVNPMHIQNGEAASSESFNTQPWSPNNYFGLPPKVAKFHDYFTSCLPSPQKGEASSVALTGNAPVSVTMPAGSLKLDNAGLNVAAGKVFNPIIYNNLGTAYSSAGGMPLHVSAGQTPYLGVNLSSAGSSSISQVGLALTNPLDQIMNGEADLSNLATVTVNDLRFAFQYQKMLERDSYSGSRYVEYGMAHFGVSAGDYRLQRSEFLGGRRSPLSIHQVTQTTGSGSDSSPLGEVGAYSLSNSNSRFTKGFPENGYVIGVYCIRQFHTYQQGVERFWKRSKRVDFYDPVFSHIGEQPVYKDELYSTNTPERVPFGYNEAWADLRARPNRVTGQMRSNITDSLDYWHFADNYANAPTLNQGFIEETPSYVDRAITVESGSQDQFILDFWIQNIAYRTLPTYSVPSLIDHD